MSGTVTDPPDGWTVDSNEMSVDFYWGADGEGTLAAKEVGIANPRPLMIKSRDSGGDGYIFQGSDGTCYLWNMVMGEVYQYTNPTALDQILVEMRKPAGRGNVQVKLLPES